MPKNAFLFHSPATNVTGDKLAAALDITAGSKLPNVGKKVVIGWGCKTKDDVTFPAGTVILNHPNHVRDNRNKFSSLEKMRQGGVNVANFIKADKVVAAIDAAAGNVKLPLVGRTSFHQAGKGFWLCLTKAHVVNAIKEGAQYFQDYLDIKDEYRLHCFQGKLICAQKKVQRDDVPAAFAELHEEKVKEAAVKGNVALDDATLKYVLERMAKNNAFADMIIRSNMRGWKFSQLNLANVNQDLKTIAVAALAATHLDFGAVDCCVLNDGTVAVIEINSGPGLKETSFDAYVVALTEAIDVALTPPKPAAAAAPLKKAVAGKAGVVAADNKKPLADVPAGGAKAALKAKVAMISQMLEVASDDEAAVLTGLLAKLG
jgi:glutathione synthase/RimK-type ligase-like ATP-grasp enzyme